MSQKETKVIGFFAYASPNEVVCTDGAACVITGSYKQMEKYLKEIDPQNTRKQTIKKTRFGEILRGLRLGAAYAFDKRSYNQFYPLAIEAGLDVQSADFDNVTQEGNRFFTVQIISN